MSNTSPPQGNEQHISAATVINAIRQLMRVQPSRAARPGLVGYFVLKARVGSEGRTLDVGSAGDESVKAELDRYFLLAPEATRPYVNPFGVHRGRLEWLRPGWERWGFFTWLYTGRALANFVNVEPGEHGNASKVSLRPTTASELAAQLKGDKLPLEPTAAFLLRRDPFPASATRDDLMARFRHVFHLNDEEIRTLFREESEFTVDFANAPFAEGAAFLPADLRPPTDNTAQAAIESAEKLHVPMAPSDVGELILDDRVMRRALRVLAHAKAVALVGPPGTGKSRLVDLLTVEAQKDPDRFALAAAPQLDRFTAEADWTARTVIGGYFPTSAGQLAFQEGYLLQAVRQNHWLVFDEMNRADLDRVLGPMLTFLAGQSVSLGMSELGSGAKPMVLAWGDEPESGVWETGDHRFYLAGTDWRFLGTYNNVDQGRVFSMGAALTRRWATIPVPPLPAERLPQVLSQLRGLSPQTISTITRLYELHLALLPLGPAPFRDMAQYVVVAGEDVDTATVVDEITSLVDAYVMYIGPQLRRLFGEGREAFFNQLAPIIGIEAIDELRAIL